MSQLTENETVLSTEMDQIIQEKTYTFATKDTYCDKDISITINIPRIVLNNNTTFIVCDGLNEWTWTKDENGNIIIT